MTQPLPEQPPLPPAELNYETPPPHGNAPMLVKLAGIFAFISAGVDLLQVAASIAMILFMHYALTHAAFAPPAPVAPAPPAAVLIAPAAAVGPEAAATLPASAPAVPVPAIPAPAPGPGAPPPIFAPGATPPEWLFIAMYGIPGLLSLLVITPKLIGATKMLRRRKRAWAWGLATGIICCCEWWMLTPCCLLLIVPLGTGIYTIVILCLPHVREYFLVSRAAS